MKAHTGIHYTFSLSTLMILHEKLSHSRKMKGQNTSLKHLRETLFCRQNLITQASCLKVKEEIREKTYLKNVPIVTFKIRINPHDVQTNMTELESVAKVLDHVLL